MRTPEQPLVVRLANAVGDIVMMRPALELLIGKGFSLTTTAPPFAKSLLHGLDLDFVPLPKSRSDFRELRSQGASHALTLRSSFRSSQELRSAGLKVIGFRSDLRSLLLWRSMRRPNGHHKIVEYHRLAEFAAAMIAGEPAPSTFLSPGVPQIDIPAGDADEATQRLEEAGVKPPYVVCCPTVAAHHPPGFKVWPEFPRLYQELDRSGVTVVTCPGPGEKERCLAASPRGTLLEGTTLPVLAAVLARASTVVSNDTGTMHLAAAVGAPTLGLFGDTDPTRYAPSSKKSLTLGRLNSWPSLEEVLSHL